MKRKRKILGDIECLEIGEALANPDGLDTLIADYRSELRKLRRMLIGVATIAIVAVLTIGLMKTFRVQTDQPSIHDAETAIEAVSILDRRLHLDRSSERITSSYLFFLAIIFFVGISSAIHRSILDSRLNSLLLYRAIRNGNNGTSELPSAAESE